MERTPHHPRDAVRDAQQAVADSVLTELELGLTFLDVAETSTSRQHRRQSIEHAATALRTADKFLSGVPADTLKYVDGIRERRIELAQRLWAVSNVERESYLAGTRSSPT